MFRQLKEISCHRLPNFDGSAYNDDGKKSNHAKKSHIIILKMSLTCHIDLTLVTLHFHSTNQLCSTELLVKTFKNTFPVHVDLSLSIYKEDFDLLDETLLGNCNKNVFLKGFEFRYLCVVGVKF